MPIDATDAKAQGPSVTAAEPRRDEAEDDPDHQAEGELAGEQHREVADAVVGMLDPGDQAERECDGHRVVRAGLDREQCGESAA